MPLIKGKSKKAFDHNVKAEMDSGKPQDQALAIAYHVQRKNRKKMAQGGEVKMEERMAKHDHMRDMDDAREEHPSSIAEAILRKKHYADGGEVDLDENAEESPNVMDELNYEALKKENYAEESALEEASHPMDSNMKGHELEDEHDHVEMMRRRIMAKRGR